MKKIKVMGMCLSILLSFTVSFMFIESVSAGSSIYVSTTGDDSTGDGSIGSPYATLWKACNESANGDTIYMRGGTYTPVSYAAWIDKDDATGDWLTIQSYPGETVIINGTHCPEGNYTSMIRVEDTNYLRVSNITFEWSYGGGIDFYGNCDHMRVDNCSIINCSTFAIKSRTDYSTPCSNITIDYNYIYGNELNWSGYAAQEVISFSGVKDFEIHHNTFRNNHYTNIDLKTSTQRGSVHHNDCNTTATQNYRIGVYYWGALFFYIDARGDVKDISVYDNYVEGNQSWVKIGSEDDGGSVENISIYNNVFYRSDGEYSFNIGFTTTSNTTHQDIYVYSNTMVATGTVIRILTYKPFYDNVMIWNNIICSGYYAFSFYRINSTDASIPVNFSNNIFHRFGSTVHNIYADGEDKSYGINATFTDPQFADRYTYDFHLNETSPAVNNATATLIPVKDYDELTRPQGEGYDIGAYEFYEESENPPSNDGYQFWNVTISDPDGDTTSGTIVCSDGSSMSWTDEVNGTRSLNMTHLEYDTNYTVWLNFTDGVCSVYEVYWFVAESGPSLAVDNPYPVDESVDVARPPVNLSAFITGSDIDVYFYFVNMTPTADVWTLVDSWNGISDERVAYTTLSTFGTTYEFLWGNTTYTWSVNCTDGVDWVNESYSFTTVADAGGSDARYDVDNDDNVFVGDLNSVWSKRTGQSSYIGLYDVDEDDTVFVGDLNTIWANR